MDNVTINFRLPVVPDKPCKIVDNVKNVDKWGKTHTSRRPISTKKIGLRDGD